MSLREMPPAQAGAAVGARLGRAPQDAVEAAIVLEAWRGLRPETALQLGHGVAIAVTPTPTPTPTPVRAPRRDEHPPQTFAVQAVALLVMLGAVGLWAAPMIEWIGSTPFAVAWRAALPFVLGVQWVVQSRFVEGQRLSQLRPHRRAMAAGGAATVCLLLLLPPSALVVAVGLVVPWVGMVVLAERRLWAAAYVGGTLAVSHLLRAGAAPRAALGILSAATLVAVVLAVSASPTASIRPNPLRPSLLAGAVGAGLGGLLVVGSLGRQSSEGVLATSLMIPSVVGALWGSARLRSLWHAIPHSLRTVSLLGQGRVPRTPATAVALASTSRYLVSTAALSVVVIGIGPPAHTRAIGLAVGYAVVGFAGLVATLSWSYGFHLWTVLGVATGLGVAGLLQATNAAEGMALAGGGLVACLVVAWPVGGALAGVERSFATRLQIP